MKLSYLTFGLVSIICLSLTFGFTATEETNGKILTVRTSEVFGPYDNSITIIYEDGKMEKTELKKLKLGDLSINLVTINQTLNNISNKGYKLISTSGGGNEGLYMTTYTFVKE